MLCFSIIFYNFQSPWNSSLPSFTSFSWLSVTILPFSYNYLSMSIDILKPLSVLVFPMGYITVSYELNNFPIQFIVIYNNIWCSILLHLSIPRSSLCNIHRMELPFPPHLWGNLSNIDLIKVSISFHSFPLFLKFSISFFFLLFTEMRGSSFSRNFTIYRLCARTVHWNW